MASGVSAAILADLAADYGAVESGFTTGTQAVIPTTNGTWQYYLLSGSDKMLLGYGDVGNLNPRAQGFRPEGGSQYYNEVSSQMLCDTDTNASNPITTAMGKLNLHPSNDTNATVLEWSSETYCGPVRITGFAQHAKASGTGTNYTLSYQDSGNFRTSVENETISVQSSGKEFSTSLIYTPNSVLGMAFRANNADYANGTSYLGMQVEALPYITSIADSYQTSTPAEGWSYWSANAAHLADATNSREMTYGTVSGGAGYVATNDSGVSPNKVHGNSFSRNASQLEIHPENPETGRNFIILKYDLGEEEAGWFNILGNVGAEVLGNIDWNSVVFSILADGSEIYRYDPIFDSDLAPHPILPTQDFFVEDFFAEETIEFVVNSLGQYNGDSTLLAAYIMRGTGPAGVPEPGTLWLLGLGLVWLGRRFWKR
ncbi:MAG: PEP-CTERM sorting domain-containing protein [Planctomycetia bacterium]|nr:PEP-CTERM sorting domain-containing protein [Planctomycetia bacterium]